MKYDSNIHQRKSIRLKQHNYSHAGAYFITICTHNREHLFGEIMDGKMMINQYGKIVIDCWHDLSNHYKNVSLDDFVVMPDHIHGIFIISPNNNISASSVGAGFKPALFKSKPAIISVRTDTRAGFKPAPTILWNKLNHGLPEIVRGFKTFSARRINNNPWNI